MMRSSKAVRSKFFFWAAAFLAVSLMLLSVFNSIFLKRLDEQYSGLIYEKLQVINLVRLVTRQSSESNRSLLNYLVGDPQEHAYQLERYRKAIASNQENLAKLDALADEESIKPFVEQLHKVRAEFLKAAEQLITMADTEPHDVVEKYRIQTVRPAFDKYLQAQDSLAEQVQKDAEESSRQLSSSAGTWRLISVTFGAWPLLLALLIGTLLATVLAWLGWRHDEAQ